jgi:Domain of unknown function (DUF1924)
MNRFLLIVCPIVVLLLNSAAIADPARDAILAALAAKAKSDNPAFTGFSVDAGKAFWFATQSGGKPDTPSCTTCHTQDPKASGKTRAGKAIAPMAVSVTPRRFTDTAEVEKWFLRNCNGVLGRECSAAEKGNVITYLSSQ